MSRSADFEEAFIADRLSLARDAVTMVLGDLHRTTATRPEVVVDLWMDQVIRISINDNFTTPSMSAIASPAAFAEVGDYFQAQLVSTLGCWPVCDRHGFGLHAEVRDGTAVWWCRRFQHVAARVGSLGVGSARA